MSRFTMNLDEKEDKLITEIFQKIGTKRSEALKRGLVLYAEKFGVKPS